MSAYFITSTGTEIGKTFVTCALVHQLKQAGRPVEAYKPLISGIPNPSSWRSTSGSHIAEIDPGVRHQDDSNTLSDTDTGQIAQSLGLSLTKETIDHLSPWQFQAPLSPHVAAEREGREIDVVELEAWSRVKIEAHDGTLLIEGVGGVMVPLNREKTVLDWIDALNLPTILVIGSYLGSLSHTLTALEVMKARSVHCAGIVVSEVTPNADIKAEETIAMLKGLIDPSLPCLSLSYCDGGWKNAPNLLSLLA